MTKTTPHSNHIFSEEEVKNIVIDATCSIFWTIKPIENHFVLEFLKNNYGLDLSDKEVFAYDLYRDTSGERADDIFSMEIICTPGFVDVSFENEHRVWGPEKMVANMELNYLLRSEFSTH